MSRAKGFIRSYNEIADYMRRLTGLGMDASFSKLVDRAAEKNAAIRAEAVRLKDYSELRNAIVHHRTYPEEIIAEPSEEALARFRAVVHTVLSPKRLIPTFQRPVRCFLLSDPLAEVLKYMGQHDYSQIVLRGREGLSILTTEGIARWLERQALNDIISITETSVANVHAHEEPEGFLVMGRECSTYDARQAFSDAIDQKRPRLFAVIITQTGKETEAPLGIVTPWDLLDKSHA